MNLAVDFQTLFNLCIGVGLPAVGWFAHQLWDDMKEQRAALNAFKEKVAETYITKEDHGDSHTQLREDLAGMRGLLHDILVRLGGGK